MRYSRALLVLSVISAILLSVSATLYADDGLLAKGIAEYNQENYEEALVILKEARQKSPASSSAAYYLGLVYEKMGQNTEAVQQLKAAVTLKPVEKKAYGELVEISYGLNNAGDAKSFYAKAEADGVSPSELAIMKGLIFLMDDKKSDAIAAFNNAKEIDSSLTQKADFYIGVANSKDEITAMRNGAGLWDFTVGAAVQYDDNVVANPSTQIPGVESISGEEDISLIAMFDARYRRQLQNSWFLNAGYRIYSNNYGDTRSYNLLVQKLSVEPRYKDFSFPFEFQHIFLDNDEYAYLASIRPTVNFQLDEGNISEFSIGYLHRNMLGHIDDNDDDRDGDVYSAGIGYLHPTFDGQGVVKAGYELSKDVAEGVNWNNIGNRFDIAALIPVADDVRLNLACEVFLQRYEKVNDVKRRDRTYNGSANVKWKINRGVTMNFQYAHTTADSSVSVYDYTRNTYTTAVEYTF
ncbi:MAG: tetratricopeptide repeat protein [Nitrospirae bacterium]|nr:tetratricopeptide repeat protein [Nitrospirota bacterium]